MGQLDVYSLEDISIITIVAGPASTYLSEEMEVSIESIVAYIYSANIVLKKKRVRLISIPRAAGDIVGAIHASWNYLQLTNSVFSSINRPLDSRVMWQDPVLSQWEGASDRKSLARLEDKYKW